MTNNGKPPFKIDGRKIVTEPPPAFLTDWGLTNTPRDDSLTKLLRELESAGRRPEPPKIALTTHADRTYRIGITMGIATGALAFIGGFVLSLLGLTGSVQLLVEDLGITAKLTNASPGVVFCLLGMLIVLHFKPKITRSVDRQQQSANHRYADGGHYSSRNSRYTEHHTSGARFSS